VVLPGPHVVPRGPEGGAVTRPRDKVLTEHDRQLAVTYAGLAFPMFWQRRRRAKLEDSLLYVIAWTRLDAAVHPVTREQLQ
jgi:hypothetical protein